MSNNRRNFVFRTPGLLKQGYHRQGVMCWDSYIQIAAYSKGEADRKFAQYVTYGQLLGWYK